MDTVTDAVLAANAQFYRALSLADSEAMRRVWLNSAEAVCAHPGHPPLVGWEAISASWRAIFEHQGILRVWPSDPRVRLFEQTAEVFCFENIDVGQAPQGGIVRAQATNLFRRAGQAWKLVEHHALPLPHVDPQPVELYSSN